MFVNLCHHIFLYWNPVEIYQKQPLSELLMSNYFQLELLTDKFTYNMSQKYPFNILALMPFRNLGNAYAICWTERNSPLENLWTLYYAKMQLVWATGLCSSKVRIIFVYILFENFHELIKHEFKKYKFIFGPIPGSIKDGDLVHWHWIWRARAKYIKHKKYQYQMGQNLGNCENW